MLLTIVSIISQFLHWPAGCLWSLFTGGVVWDQVGVVSLCPAQSTLNNTGQARDPLIGCARAILPFRDILNMHVYITACPCSMY